MTDNSEYAALLDPFTERELEILHLMDDGLDNRSISERLFLSRETVKWYVRQIYSKLDVHSQAEALERARAASLGHGRRQRDERALAQSPRRDDIICRS